MKSLVFTFLFLSSLSTMAANITLKNGGKIVIEPEQEKIEVTCEGKASVVCTIKTSSNGEIGVYINNELASLTYRKVNEPEAILRGFIENGICPSQKSE